MPIIVRLQFRASHINTAAATLTCTAERLQEPSTPLSPADQKSKGNMRTHLTLHNVQFTTIRGANTTSTWRAATVNIFEVPDNGAGGGRSLCGCSSLGFIVTALIDIEGGVGIYPGEPDLAEMINMCSEEWRCDINEVFISIQHSFPAPYQRRLKQIVTMLTFRKGDTPQTSLVHCLRVADRLEFMQLVGVCASIRMYYYTTYFNLV